MQVQKQIETSTWTQPGQKPGPAPEWSTGHRMFFRFVFVYFVLYLFPSPLNEIPFIGSFIGKYEVIWHKIVPWVARHFLHLSYDITVFSSGSGDTTYEYVKVLCFLTLAAAATAIWSVMDSKRIDYQRLHQWLRVYVRFSLAAVMIYYGAFKVIQSQFPPPSLDRMIQPFGDASPMGLLWTFMGASRPYNIFIGLAEITGGVLLITPLTTTLGSLIGFAVMGNIFMLNMCYDVPVKLFSLNLLLMSVFLAAPELRRLLNFFVFNRVVQATRMRPLFSRKWLNRVAVAVAIVFIAFALVSSLTTAYEDHKNYFAVKSPLYGIWSVDEFKVDGEVKPPLITNEARWRRAIFDYPDEMSVQLMSGSRQRFKLDLNLDKQSMTIGQRDNPDWKANLAVQRPQPGVVELEGTVDGKKIQAKLSRANDETFLLNSRGFHWISELPFNR